MTKARRRKAGVKQRQARFVFLAAFAFMVIAGFGVFYAKQRQLEMVASGIPPLTGFVMDRASVIDRDIRIEMEAGLRALDEEGKAQVVVATIFSTYDRSLADTAIELARQWGVGHAGRNDGVLLLLTERERQARIEVGYGLEGVLTDATSRIIIAESIAPALAAGDFTAAATQGVAAILAVIHPDPLPRPAPPGALYEFGQAAGFIFFMLLIAVIALGFAQAIVLAIPRAAERIGRSRWFGWFARIQIISFSRHKDRESSSSGGSVGGGGSFGGGGANG